MKKIVLLVTIFLICETSLFSQGYSFLWAKNLNGRSSSLSTVIDNNNNLFSIGTFGPASISQTVDVDPGPDTVIFTLIGNGDSFIQKLDKDGNFKWAKHFGGTYNTSFSKIVIDKNGNIILTGGFSDTTDFDPGPGVHNLFTTGITDVDFFTLKLDSNGNFLWVKQTGGEKFDNGEMTLLDKEGNIYTLGTFRNTVDFDPGPGIFNLVGEAQSNRFIQKLDLNGNFVWAKRIGNHDIGPFYNSIALDKNSNVYYTGVFKYTVDFDPGMDTFNLTWTSPSQDLFILKLDKNGDFIWVKQIGGGNDELLSYYVLCG